MKNYYQILNVKPTATEAEIKRSYRVLAKRYHPDVNPGDAAAADKFADINEANSVLSDAKARAEYDAKLKEAAATRLNPEDIIARQRAQAQAAARQAARNAARQATFRNPSMGANASSRRDAAMARARAQAQAQAMRNAAQAQAQAHAHAQAQAQAQAQVQVLCKQAFQNGYEQGVADTRENAETEINRINAGLQALQAENNRLKSKLEEKSSLKQKLAEAEQDRRDLEQELFNRDRELTQERIHSKDMEEQLQTARAEDEITSAAMRKATAENANLREMLDKAQLCVKKLEEDKKKLEQDKAQFVLKSQAQIQLQQDKRKQLQKQIDELTAKVAALVAESDILRAENDQWHQYARSEDFISDTERRLEDWRKKTQADRRLAKPTLYGALGVLIWATDEEISEAYAKLCKRYSGKTDEAIVAKLEKVEEAYAILSDSEKRREYNSTISITDERIEEERKLISENESLKEEYRTRLASKEFWAHYDETTAAALEGDAVAQNTLGEMFYYGDEIERDPEQAVYWFKEAAKQQHADAMYNLAICFINGEGVERNDATGKGFMRQAAKLGSKAAKDHLKIREG